MLPDLARLPSSARPGMKGAMTKFERQTMLKSRPPERQQFLCKPCYMQATGDRSAQTTDIGTCDKCQSGPTAVIRWRADTAHSTT